MVRQEHHVTMDLAHHQQIEGSCRWPFVCDIVRVVLDIMTLIGRLIIVNSHNAQPHREGTSLESGAHKAVFKM